MCLQGDFLRAQILATQTAIVDLQALAAELVVTGGITSYTLDTGQSRQVIQKLDAVRAHVEVDKLYNRLATLCARLTGSGTMTARPRW